MSTFHFIVNSSLRWPPSGPAGNPIPLYPPGIHGSFGRVRETQRRMWPAAHPNVPGLDYHAGWRPGTPRGVGLSVDFLDYFEIDGGQFAVAAGELMSAGATAEAKAPGALPLSSLHALVRSLATQPSAGLGVLVQSIHDLFYEASPEGGYATLFLARYDPIERRLDYCNAGHEAPLLLRKSGSRRRTIRLENGGPMVGVLRRSVFRQGSLRLQPGDILAAYSSGLTETANPDGEEWGSRRLVTAIEEAAHRPARDIVGQVLDEAREFSAGASGSRDVTLWLGRVEEAMAHVPSLEAAIEEPAEAAELAA